jgi:hypothetical protein
MYQFTQGFSRIKGNIISTEHQCNLHDQSAVSPELIVTTPGAACSSRRHRGQALYDLRKDKRLTPKKSVQSCTCRSSRCQVLQFVEYIGKDIAYKAVW